MLSILHRAHCHSDDSTASVSESSLNFALVSCASMCIKVTPSKITGQQTSIRFLPTRGISSALWLAHWGNRCQAELAGQGFIVV